MLFVLYPATWLPSGFVARNTRLSDPAVIVWALEVDVVNTA
jgi:hypothetical protein